MWPYVKTSVRIWLPLALGIGWVFLQFGNEALYAAKLEFQRSGSILVGATIWAQTAYWQWWVTKIMHGDQSSVSPFGDRDPKKVVKTLVEIGNVTTAIVAIRLRRMQGLLSRAIMACAMVGTMIWGYGDKLFN